MSNTIYVTASESNSGKSVIALGIMEFLVRNLNKVAFFRPIINTINGGQDTVIDLIKQTYGLKTPYEKMFAYTIDESKELVAKGRYHELLEGILEKYKFLESNYDFVLCLGSDFIGESSSFEFEINADIAKNLGCPVLIVANAHLNKASDIIKSCLLALESLEDKGCKVIACILNRTPISIQAKFLEEIHPDLKNKVDLIYSIPIEENLARISMAEIAKSLNTSILFGEQQLKRLVSRFVVAAMQLRSFLPRLTDGSLIITPVDRIDVILGTLAAFRSHTMPNIAGIILTGNMEPEKIVFDLLEGITDSIPILKTNDDTFTTADKISRITTQLSADDSRKIATALGLFESCVDTTELRKKIVGFKVGVVTPKMFEFGLIRRARANKQHIVLPEGEEDRILNAAEILVHRDLVNLTLLGDKEKILKRLSVLGLDIGDPDIIKPEESEYFDDYVKTYYSLRKHKGITLDNARDVIASVNHFGTMMVYKGQADGMVSGAVHSTRNTVRPAFEIIRTRPGSMIMSSVFFMCLEDRVLVYGDCAVNPNPDPKQLAEIAIRSAETAKIFNIEPLVAMLSYSSGTSGIGTDVDKVREATLIARKLEPDLPIEGPIQYDAAVDKNVANTKMPDSLIAGKATVLIFPDLNTGNNTYKAVQRSAKVVAIGPVMQGLNKPVNDLSRGCTVNDIVNTVAITAIQAQADKGLL